LGESDSHLSKFGGKMGSVAKGVGLGFAAMGAAAVPFGIKAVQAASDVNESFSKVNTIFGESTAVIDKWAKGAAQNIGLSRGAALDAAGTFGNMFTQLGIGTDKAAKLSTGIVDLAADFASFHNADISEVIESQSAAFRGEYDSIQKFLPLINAAAVEQKALAMTGKAATKELTAQDKALAVQKLMMEGAGAAVGDFARTSDGLANKMRILKARGEDFIATVGSALLPIVLKGIDGFMRLGAVLKDTLAPIFETVKLGVQAFMAAVREGDVTSDGFVGVMETIGDAIHRVIPVVQDIVGWVQQFVGNLRSGSGEVGEAGDKIGGVFTDLKDIVGPAFDAIRAIIEKAVEIISGLWDRFGSHLVDHLQTAFNAITQVVSGVLDVIKGIFNVFAGIFTGDWSRLWDGLKQIFEGLWNVFLGIFKTAVNTISTLIGAAMAGISAAWSAIWNGIKTVFTDIWDGIKTGISNALDGVVSAISGLKDRITSAASGMWDGIKNAFKAALNWIIDAWNAIEFKIPGIDPPGPGPKWGGITLGVPDIPHLHSGGVVPGVPGSDVLAMLQAGERVIPRGGGAGTVVSNTYAIAVTAIDPAAAQEAVVAAIREYERRNGTNWRTN
jgi:phage-related protein